MIARDIAGCAARVWLVRALWVACALLAAGCGDDDGASIQVVVSEADPGLPQRLDRIELRVSTIDGSGAENVVRTSGIDPSYDAAGRLRPWTSIVRPARAEDPGRTLYRVRAAGRSGGSEYVVRQQRLVFVQGARIVLPLRFEASCVMHACAAAETCAEGACVDDFVPACSLVSGQRPAACQDRSDAGMDASRADASPDGAADVRLSDGATGDATARDATVDDDGGGDAARDDAGSTDAGSTDAGSTDAGSTDAADVDAADVDAGSIDAATASCGAPSDCDDGNPCTADDCAAGSCTHAAMRCDDGNACTADACDVATGMCVADALADGTACAAGACCGGTCTATATDPRSCGTCGRACGTNSHCTAGACACDSGYQDCDATAGCESRPATDPLHCGSCSTRCTAPTPACIAGICRACSTGADCPDDGLSCTGAPTCGGGACQYPIVAGRCLIAGACYASNAVDSANGCQSCDPSRSTSDWSPRPNGTACNDDLYCTTPDRCNSTADCLGAARDCDDGLWCTADSCDETNDRCNHRVTLTNCLIAGVCYLDGDRDPTNDCRVCHGGTNPNAWQTRTGLGCDDGLYCTTGTTCTASAVCNGGTARGCGDGVGCTVDSCNEATDACDHTLGPTCCQIGGVIYSRHAVNPANSCQWCDAAVSATAWSPVPDDTACGSMSRGVCCAGACRGPTNMFCGCCSGCRCSAIAGESCVCTGSTCACQ